MAKMYIKTTITESAPDWSASGAEPPYSMRSNQGFVSGYKPPAAYVNWFWTKVSRLFDQILSVIDNIQDFLHNKCFYIRVDVGLVTTVGRLYSYMVENNSPYESKIIYFTVGSNMFFDYGIVYGDVGVMNCKLGVIKFPRKGIELVYTASAQNYIKVDNIADHSLSTSKINATLHTAVYDSERTTLSDLESIADNYYGDDDAIIVYFDVSGTLRDLTNGATFGMYVSWNNLFIMDNGLFYTIDNGTLTQKTVIADGIITKNNLSAELKAELGLN